MKVGGFPRTGGWILAVFAGWLSGCAPARSPDPKASPPEIRLEGVRFQLFRGGALRGDGTARELRYQRESTALAGTDLVVRLRERKETVAITAPAGEGNLGARSFAASGGLRATRGGDVAVTESARFDPEAGERGRVTGDRPVEIAGPGYRLRGDGFTLDPAEGTISLHGSTRLVAGLPGGR